MIIKNLIFDLGFHNGTDTKYYIEHGYNVVAVEANIELVKQGLQKFKSEISDGKLILLHNAISDTIGKIDFFIHYKNTDWGSCSKVFTENDSSKSKQNYVDSITIDSLFNKYGIPYYMKVDIEGNESFVVKRLLHNEKPKFVSFEISKNTFHEIISYLYVAGYRKFQLINQINNIKYSSGKFGNLLPNEKWITCDELLSRYIKYRDLKLIDNVELGVGWIDVHATE